MRRQDHVDVLRRVLHFVGHVEAKVA
jgi:hypothetical protein